LTQATWLYKVSAGYKFYFQRYRWPGGTIIALHAGDEFITDYPYEFSADYDAAFWQGGPPWNDWGNACTSY
jgi:hypothetical protein